MTIKYFLRKWNHLIKLNTLEQLSGISENKAHREKNIEDYRMPQRDAEKVITYLESLKNDIEKLIKFYNE